LDVVGCVVSVFVGGEWLLWLLCCLFVVMVFVGEVLVVGFVVFVVKDFVDVDGGMFVVVVGVIVLLCVVVVGMLCSCLGYVLGWFV